jgi:hypothetical protein
LVSFFLLLALLVKIDDVVFSLGLTLLCGSDTWRLGRRCRREYLPVWREVLGLVIGFDAFRFSPGGSAWPPACYRSRSDSRGRSVARCLSCRCFSCCASIVRR